MSKCVNRTLSQKFKFFTPSDQIGFLSGQNWPLAYNLPTDKIYLQAYSVSSTTRKQCSGSFHFNGHTFGIFHWNGHTLRFRLQTYVRTTLYSIRLLLRVSPSWL